MRISDWSSDVCSSDLEVMEGLKVAGIGSQVHYIPVHLQPYYRRRYGALTLPGAERYYARTLSLPLFAAMEESDVDREVEAQIGRASCREGVCQYVVITGVAVSLKKKTEKIYIK